MYTKQLVYLIVVKWVTVGLMIHSKVYVSLVELNVNHALYKLDAMTVERVQVILQTHQVLKNVKVRTFLRHIYFRMRKQ